MPVLLLFDIDGTILRMKQGRSRLIFADIMKDVFDVCVPDDAMPNFACMTDLGILREIAETIGIPFEEIKKRQEIIWEKMLTVFRHHCTKEYVQILPGVNSLIRFFSEQSEFELGLCTGNFRNNAYLKLRTFDLDGFFPFGAFGSDFEDRNLLPPLAIERGNKLYNKNMFSEKNTIVIGDGPRDIKCAKANGLPVVCVATGGFEAGELSSYEPDLLFEDFFDYESVAVQIIKNFG